MLTSSYLYKTLLPWSVLKDLAIKETGVVVSALLYEEVCLLSIVNAFLPNSKYKS